MGTPPRGRTETMRPGEVGRGKEIYLYMRTSQRVS